ncbi:YopX family protein [Bacillus halotolerans]|uniref:YopX family protein n=1 Tax=Bacillus halotolerans TaxID=260554 RepID=UPI002DBE160E|nr:YopX family protein [Bacillus halotolerans]MEC1406843.1 YopX family protein [Bacillus halotolerans]
MREIKFRAWDKKHNHFFDVKEFGKDGSNCWASSKRGGYRHWNPIFVQYTGLKDMNGREIYEGDIIHCVHWFFDGNEIEERFTASVGFRDGSFTLENINSRYYSDYTGEENVKGICWIGDINYCEEDYEVIGNIYEDPGLIESK